MTLIRFQIWCISNQYLQSYKLLVPLFGLKWFKIFTYIICVAFLSSIYIDVDGCLAVCLILYHECHMA